jgi:hypothetical protein
MFSIRLKKQTKKDWLSIKNQNFLFQKKKQKLKIVLNCTIQNMTLMIFSTQVFSE